MKNSRWTIVVYSVYVPNTGRVLVFTPRPGGSATNVFLTVEMEFVLAI